MDYKYGGHSYSLFLNSDGLIEARGEGITGPGVEEVKALIRERDKVEKAAPRIKVLVFDRFGSDLEYFEGTVSAKVAGDSYPFVSYAGADRFGRSKNVRQKISNDFVYLDTIANRTRLDQMIELKKEATIIKQRIQTLRDGLQTLADVPDNQP